MLTNEQIKEFADSLAAVGVIKGGQQKALIKIQPDKGKSAAYGVQLERAFERIKKLEHDARARGYREAEMKIIRGAVNSFVSFAKRNAERLQNREVSALDEQLNQFENQYIMISYEEGDTIMNIRENAQQIIGVYQNGLPSMEADTRGDRTALDKVKKAQGYISEIASSIDSVADGSSDNAAKLQKQIIDSLARWAHEFANGNFADSALNELQKAASAAKSWSALKAPALKSTGGLFGFLNKGTKEAEEGSYYTYEQAMQNGDHQRIRTLAKYPEAKTKVEAIQNLIARTRSNLDTSGEMAMQQTLNNYKERKKQLEAELDAVALRYELSCQGGQEGDFLLADQLENLDEQILNIDEEIAEYQLTMSAQQRSRQADEFTLGYLEQTYQILTTVMNNKSNLVALASYVDFAVLSKILENTATPEEMSQFVNMDALVKAATSMGVKTHQDLREQRQSIRSITHEGERTAYTQGQTTAHEQRQQQANSRAQEILNRRKRTQAPAETTATTETQTTGGISLDGMSLGNDT